MLKNKSIKIKQKHIRNNRRTTRQGQELHNSFLGILKKKSEKLFKQNIYCQASSRHQVAFTKVMIIGVEDKVHFIIHKFGLESTGSKPLKKAKSLFS